MIVVNGIVGMAGDLLLACVVSAFALGGDLYCFQVDISCLVHHEAIFQGMRNTMVLTNCHACDAKPGKIHEDGCDVECCSVCGGQLIQCDCEYHDKAFARWTGIWPGKAEAKFLDVDLNVFDIKYSKLFFVKPLLITKIEGGN